jgi:F0F1-type ATP synthase beta subunit
MRLMIGKENNNPIVRIVRIIETLTAKCSLKSKIDSFEIYPKIRPINSNSNVIKGPKIKADIIVMTGTLAP